MVKSYYSNRNFKGLKLYAPRGFTFTYIWKIENFMMGIPFRDQWFCSPPITLPLTKMSWKIMLHPKFHSRKYLSIYIHRISEENSPDDYEFEVRLAVESKPSWKRKYITAKNIEAYVYWGSKSFVRWASLILDKEVLLPNDTLTISCDISVSNFPDRQCLASLLADVKLIYDEETKYSILSSGNDGKSFSKEIEIKETSGKGRILKNSNSENQVFAKHSAHSSFKDGESFSKETQIKKTSVNDGILNSTISERHSFGKQNSLAVKNHVLHKWFQHLYSGKLPDTTLQDLESDFAEVILKDMKRWPSDVPQVWSFRTFLNIEETYFTSYIREFSQLRLEDKFFSSPFRCGSSDWKLMFCLSSTASGKEVLRIFICPMSFHFLSKKIFKCKISVVTKDGRLPLSEEHVHCYHNNGQWEHPPFIYTEFLNNNKKLYLENDILTLFCKFSFSDGTYSSDGKFSWEVSDWNYDPISIDLLGMCHLREDLKDLLDSGFYSDVILKVDKAKIPAHRSILSQRSEKFRHIISAMEEKDKSVIEIQNISEETMKKVLKCIYCGNFDVDAQFVFNRKCYL